MAHLVLSLQLALFLASMPFVLVRVAGTGEPGYSGDGGSATQARLNMPFDLVFDAKGNLYFSDAFNHCVRRIDAASGVIETVAGNGTKGFSGDGGPAKKAQLNEPYGLAMDRLGNLYVVDRLNHRVRRVDAQTGVITTVAGDGSTKYSGDGGPAALAGLVEPNGVALDAQGRLLIADVAGHRVRMVDFATGQITTFAGTGRGAHAGDGGPARNAAIFGARAVEVGPDGTVWIVEREGNSLRAVDPKTGIISTRAGTGAKGYSGDGGPASVATFNGPKELAVDPAGNIFIVDTENHAIRRIEAQTGQVSTVAGDGQRASEQDVGPAKEVRLDRPHGVAIGADGAVYIGDTGNHRVLKVRP
jgi:DNA-binding beta-propeller fold protein YncE